jgi:hypothetical protein
MEINRLLSVPILVPVVSSVFLHGITDSCRKYSGFRSFELSYCSLRALSGPENLVYIFEFSVDSSCSFEQRLANSGHPLLSLVATVTETQHHQSHSLLKPDC